MQLRFKVAGISDMGLVRTNNEDNFQIARDLSVEPMRWINNEACLLTPHGTLLVVADGMGGMNAGEVASQIAIDTVKEVFSPAALAGVNLLSVADVNAHIAGAVAEADSRIKRTAAARPETHGMGTTIVIAWLLDGKLYMGWCGDSRAYIYNPACGLRRLSKDHSYVQTLVDAGKLTDEQAFDYPQSNIITRCLSDSNAVAEADVLPRPVTVADGDIILLCTDGLCGMIRDNEIERILRDTPAADLTGIAKSLVDGALSAGGADNVTVALLQVISGGAKAAQRALPARFGADTPSDRGDAVGKGCDVKGGMKPRGWMLIALGGIVAGIIMAILAFTLWNGDKEKGETAETDIDLISNRDSLYQAQNPSYQQESDQQAPQDNNPENNQASQIGNSLGNQFAAIAAGMSSTGKTTPGQTTPGQPVAGQTTPASPLNNSSSDKAPVNDGQADKEHQPDAGKGPVNKDSVAPPKSPVPPAKREIIKVEIGNRSAKIIASEYGMKLKEFYLLNSDIDFKHEVAPGTYVKVYKKPSK